MKCPNPARVFFEVRGRRLPMPGVRARGSWRDMHSAQIATLSAQLARELEREPVVAVPNRHTP